MLLYALIAIVCLLTVATWEVRDRLQARAYQRECGDRDPIVPVLVYSERPCVPRFETYRDWTLGLDD